MNKLVTLVCTGGLVSGIGSALAQDDEPALELASKIVPVEMYACNYNDGQGPDDLHEVINGWSGFMDEKGVDHYAAWTLDKFFTGPDQGFDFLWLGAWTDGNAMGGDLDMWLSTGGEHIANFARVADCGTHISAASINYKLPEGGTPGDGVLTFSNCTIKEGQSYAAVANATSAWVDVLTNSGSNSAVYHWFPVYGASPDASDYQLVTSYENYADLGADLERRTNGELFRQRNALLSDLVECDVARVYNATSRRAAQLR